MEYSLPYAILLLVPFLLVRLNVWWCRRQFVRPLDQRWGARRGALGMLALLVVLAGPLLGFSYMVLSSAGGYGLGEALFELLCRWVGMGMAAAVVAALPQILSGPIPEEQSSTGLTSS
ncbi:MAG: hypothetical protein KF760_10275 [Candidatus Eremiobacteraeota bacterium]|nr:hypothetical protein [Candidatus Eremiobacteraeota bacterium]MCW5867682.1 hypothetical protein [Candidatus Eremiobacteraeota bacterium]